MESFNVKIAKTATSRSIMDVTESLHFYQTKNDEDVYKGKIIFSITEVGKNKYEKAYVDKAVAKVVLHAMIQHTFSKLYPGGFTDYGGSKKDGNIRSRVFKIEPGKNGKGQPQFIFTVEEGPGVVGKNGNIEPVKGSRPNRVQTYLSYLEGLKMAHEVYDYIRNEELKATLKGKPLHTIVRRSFQQQQTQPPAASAEKTEYVIPAGKLKGQKMSSLEDKMLNYIASLPEDADPTIREIQRQAKLELQRRKN